MLASSPKVGHLQLAFDKVKPSDASNYTCRSRNTVGMDEQLASLIVQCKYFSSVSQYCYYSVSIVAVYQSNIITV